MQSETGSLILTNRRKGAGEEERTRKQNGSTTPNHNVTVSVIEQVHVQSCAPAPLSCPHFGLYTYSQNQVHNESTTLRREEATNFEDT